MRTDELLDEYRCDHARVRLPAGWSVPGWQTAWAAWASRAPDGANTLFVRAGWWDRAVPLARRVDELGLIGGWLLGEGFVGPAPAARVEKPAPGSGDGREVVAAATAGRWLDADGVLRPHGYAVAEVFFPSGHVVRVDLVSEVADAEAARALLAAVAAVVEVVPVPLPAEWTEGAAPERPATSGADTPAPPRRERPVRVRAAGRAGARPHTRRPDHADGAASDTSAPDTPAAGPAEAQAPRDDDPDALPAPYVRYVPADRFVPEAPADARPAFPAPPPLAPSPPAFPTPPPPTPPRRPAALLYAAALAPLVAFVLPWFEDPRTVANGWFTLRYAPPRTGVDLAGDAPMLWALPALAVASVVAVARWRAAPDAATWRRGVGGVPLAGVAVLVLAGVPDVAGTVDIGVAVVLVAWGLQLLEVLTFRAR